MQWYLFRVVVLQDPLYDELLGAGCIYQERLGWERPGWFDTESLTNGGTPALSYDWYGAYDHEANEPDGYKKLLNMDYTYEYPQHHDQVRGTLYSNTAYVLQLQVV